MLKDLEGRTICVSQVSEAAASSLHVMNAKLQEIANVRKHYTKTVFIHYMNI